MKEDSSTHESTKLASELTGTDIEANYFADDADAKAFFESHGFNVKYQRIGELVRNLTCISNPALDKNMISKQAKIALDMKVWQMTPR